MSGKMTARVWALNDEELKDARLLTLLSLADFANSDDAAWPSIPTLAQRTRISERQIQRSIQWLCQYGYIEITEKGNGRGRVTTYKLLVKGDIIDKKDDTMTPFSTEGLTPVDSIKGDIQSAKGDIENIKGDIDDGNYSHVRREPKKKPTTKKVKAIAADATPADPPEWQLFVSGLCNCCYKHTDISALSAKDKGLLLSEAKKIHDDGYTLDDIRHWFGKEWVNDWRYGAKKNRPTPSQVRSGIPSIRTQPDEAYELPVSRNGTSNGNYSGSNQTNHREPQVAQFTTEQRLAYDAQRIEEGRPF